MAAVEIENGLILVELDPGIPGFRNFLGAWIVTENGRTLLVDPGPVNTIDAVFTALLAYGGLQPDAVLLTHIHIDHAGGAGAVVNRFPCTRVFCQAAGIPHLIDPAKLQAGTEKTLGDLATVYGPILPLPAGALHDAKTLTGSEESPLPGVTAIETPGHAVHHVSFVAGRRLFAGEAAGNYVKTSGGGEILRPATPPRFIPEIYLQSLERLRNVPHETICYGHYGATTAAPHRFESHRRQVGMWIDVVKEWRGRTGDSAAALPGAAETLIHTDPLLKNRHTLTPEEAAREDRFIMNSLRGIDGWLSRTKTDRS
jgi:glyoxylase-like metal-dependent hydrolase (beta-lactamase superfamily II)